MFKRYVQVFALRGNLWKIQQRGVKQIVILDMHSLILDIVLLDVLVIHKPLPMKPMIYVFTNANL